MPKEEMDLPQKTLNWIIFIVNKSDIKKGLNGLAFNSISSLAMSNQMIIKIIKYL